MSDWIPSYRAPYPENFIGAVAELHDLSNETLVKLAKERVETEGHYYAGYTALDVLIAALIERIERLTKETT